MLDGTGYGMPPSAAWPPDIAASAYEVGAIRVLAASLRGLLHRGPGNGEPRQDGYSIAFDEASKTLVAVVCDGVGSLKYSHEAAALVVNDLPWRYLSMGNWKDAIGEVNAVLAERERDLVEALSEGSRALATTVVAVAVRQTDRGYDLSFACVGDSEAWSLSPTGSWTKIVPPSDDSFDDGVTTGKTKALPTFEPILLEHKMSVDGGRIFLMTDGVGVPLDMNSQVQAQLADWWQEPSDPITFARQVGFARRTFIDDRTAVGIWLNYSEDLGG